MSELFTPPKYFQDVKFHRHTDRTIGWLELFYDLVYVVLIGELAAHPGWQGGVSFVAHRI